MVHNLALLMRAKFRKKHKKQVLQSFKMVWFSTIMAT